MASLLTAYLMANYCCSHMKKKENIWLDFVPQIMFLMFFFGYLGFMIVLKYFLYESSA